MGANKSRQQGCNAAARQNAAHNPSRARQALRAHTSLLLPRTAFGPGAYARKNVRPALVHPAPMLILDHPQRLVVEPDQGSSLLLAQPVLNVRSHRIGHEQRPGNLQQDRPLDRLYVPPQMAVVLAQIAEPSPSWPGLDLHRHLSAVGCVVLDRKSVV